jgi:hypothetical protein
MATLGYGPTSEAVRKADPSELVTVFPFGMSTEQAEEWLWPAPVLSNHVFFKSRGGENTPTHKKVVQQM